MSAARITSLTIEGFRGFRESMTLDFDASAVLFSGPNGTGKTSVFDALQWLLREDVPRLRGYTLRRNEEYLANTYQLDTPARVLAEFRLPLGTLTAIRTGNARGSSLEVTVGDQRHVGADATRVLASSLVHGELSLPEVLATSGLLQQDDLRQILETKPDERYRQLLRLLGLEVLERFERFAATNRIRTRATTRAARGTLDLLRGEVTALQERLDTSRQQVDRWSPAELNTRAVAVAVDTYADVLRVIDAPTSAEDLAALGASARSTGDLVRRERSSLLTLPDSLPPDGRLLLEQTQAARAAAETQLKGALQQKAEAEAALRSAEALQDTVGRLAAAAIPLLPVTEDSAPCPVCQSIIHPREVADDLAARAGSGVAVAAARVVADAATDRVRESESLAAAEMQAETSVREQASARRAHLELLQQTNGRLARLRASPPAPLLRITAELDLGKAVEMRRAAGIDAVESADDGDNLFAAWVDVRRERLATLERLADALTNVADAAAAAAAAASAARLAAERAAALPRQQAHHDERQSRLNSQELVYDQARRAETMAVALAESATAAAAELFRERFSGLEPLMNDIYSRLDPHPAFTRLDFRIETYRSRGTATANVIDVVEKVSANPMLVFSSAQANAVVLAAFLALGWAAGDRGLPFVLLDDPLQALDDVNVLGFADLVRHLRRQRQIAVATHEERFASLLERKLTGRADGEELILHRFVGWSRLGPRVETRRVSPQPELRLRVLAS